MPFVSQSEARPTQIQFALTGLADSDVTRLRIAVAYVTLTGCKTLFPSLETRIGDEKWRAIPKEFITSFDFGATDPEALRQMQRLPRSVVRIANLQAPAEPAPSGARNFHPKLYIFDKGDRRDYLCGSPNLSGRALTVNSEAAIVLTRASLDIDGSWSDMWDRATPLTEDLLRRYEGARVRPPRYEPDAPVAAPAIPAAGGLQPFGDAIAVGGLDPSSFEQFWVEAGSMSSGGSHNQLELPRGANNFFGQVFANYAAGGVERIADLALMASGRRWPARPLTWHGDNRMERLNLPTVAQGGFDYPNTAILFRRVGHSYELEVADWESPTAIAWRTASLRSGRLYRAGGAASPRICGLI